MFDSALLEWEDGSRRERPAYCVLGYASDECPPGVEMTTRTATAGQGGCVGNVPIQTIVVCGFRVEPHAALAANSREIGDLLPAALAVGVRLDAYSKLVGVSRPTLYRWQRTSSTRDES